MTEPIYYACSTLSGVKFTPWTLAADQINLRDICTSLSAINRFGGHTALPYSVAAHSLAVAQYVADRGAGTLECLSALLHDAPEAYIGDWPAPWRALVRIHTPDRGALSIAQIEAQIFTKIGEYLDLPLRITARIEAADRALCEIEAATLRNAHIAEAAPLPDAIRKYWPQAPLQTAYTMHNKILDLRTLAYLERNAAK